MKFFLGESSSPREKQKKQILPPRRAQDYTPWLQRYIE